MFVIELNEQIMQYTYKICFKHDCEWKSGSYSCRTSI